MPAWPVTAGALQTLIQTRRFGLEGRSGGGALAIGLREDALEVGGRRSGDRPPRGCTPPQTHHRR